MSICLAMLKSLVLCLCHACNSNKPTSSVFPKISVLGVWFLGLVPISQRSKGGPQLEEYIRMYICDTLACIDVCTVRPVHLNYMHVSMYVRPSNPAILLLLPIQEFLYPLFEFRLWLQHLGGEGRAVERIVLIVQEMLHDTRPIEDHTATVMWVNSNPKKKKKTGEILCMYVYQSKIIPLLLCRFKTFEKNFF